MRRAFTLIELLLVLVLTASLAGSVAVSLAGRAETVAVSLVADDIASAVTFAVSSHRSSGVAHRVVLDRSRVPDRYRVEREAGASSPNGSGWTRVAGLAGRYRSLPPGVVLSVAGAAMELDRSVIYDTSSPVASEIRVLGKSHELTLSMAPLTGLVSTERESDGSDR
ncbi:MAG: prepilin-type N-terminal cleavage/methylation domain-containing protein [Planctomycetota bacterium]